MNLPKISPAVAALVLTLGAANAESFVRNEQERARIESAIPDRAPAKPARPRRLLIFTLNVGYPGHPSMAHANEAFTLMGRKTGAFETTVSADPQIFQRESLANFDAVFFNNTVGNCFTNADLRRNLLEFVTGGGGLLGVHGTSVAFTHWPGAIEDWPEFGYLIGARGANHKDSDEQVWMKLDDPQNPILQVFGGQGFAYRDEYFRPQGTYSRNRVRVLLSMDTTKTDPEKGQPRGDCHRPDGDYAVAWIRNYGRGRVFYTTIAHNPYVFWDAKMLRFYLAAIQFALGDLQCPTTPSARLTPATRAQEQLGWRMAVDSDGRTSTLYAEAQRASELGMPYVSAASTQQVGDALAKPFSSQLTDSELEQVRLRLETLGLRLLSYRLLEPLRTDQAVRELFDFGRKMGVETFVLEQNPESLPLIESLSQQTGIHVALQSRSEAEARQLAKLLRNRNRQLGVSLDLTTGARSWRDPDGAARTAGDRLLNVRMAAEGPDPVAMRKFFEEVKRSSARPVFSIVSDNPKPSRQTVDLLNAEALRLAGGAK